LKLIKTNGFVYGQIITFTNFIPLNLGKKSKFREIKYFNSLNAIFFVPLQRNKIDMA